MSSLQAIKQMIKKPKEAGYTYVMPFGKHMGKTIKEILWEEPEYIIWLSENVTNIPKIRREIVKQAVDERGWEPEPDHDYWRD